MRLQLRTLDLFIAGRWRPGAGGYGPVVNPATAEPVARHAIASAGDLDEALEAAADGFERWSKVPAGERGAVLERTARLLRASAKDWARELTAENGKTLAESEGEIGRAIEHFEWYGAEAARIEGRLAPPRQATHQRLIVPQPLGVVVAFTAWNFPAVLVARKLSAALAAGCAVILKAAEETPTVAVRIVEALTEAGLPAGAVNLVFGDPPTISSHLLASPIVRKLTFTGSTSVGRTLARLAADDLKRCTFELGGHAPVIVCADADVEKAVAATIPYKFTSAGQSCVAPSRFYVHESLYADCLARFTAAAAAITVGDGSEAGVRMGPLATRRRLEAMERLTGDAVQHGARAVLGGKRLDRKGWFFPPTVLADVPEDAAVMNEEPFGPIAPFASFRDLDDAVARANRLRYGFTAYAFTRSLETAAALSARLKAGNVGINQMCPSLPDVPIGGVDQSGYGYEGGRAGLEEFLHFRLVSQTFA
jgi:succinate-semialdehyde dehydrogenase/glutarate-semialdehyde dehydrogenase